MAVQDGGTRVLPPCIPEFRGAWPRAAANCRLSRPFSKLN
jgi:hypothetical protein